MFTFPFSRMGLGFAMRADGGTIYFYFFTVQVSTLWQGNSENYSNLKLKNSNKFVTVIYLFRKMPILDPNYPHPTL